MKRETFFGSVMFAAFVGCVFCLGAMSARAQNVRGGVADDFLRGQRALTVIKK